MSQSRSWHQTLSHRQSTHHHAITAITPSNAETEVIRERCNLFQSLQPRLYNAVIYNQMLPHKKLLSCQSCTAIWVSLGCSPSRTPASPKQGPQKDVRYTVRAECRPAMTRVRPFLQRGVSVNEPDWSPTSSPDSRLLLNEVPELAHRFGHSGAWRSSVE